MPFDPEAFRVLGAKVWGLTGSLPAVRRHRVGPLLHLAGFPDIPTEVRAECRAAFVRTLAQNLLFLSETRRVHSLLCARIPVLPLKGVLFAGRFYPHLGVRPQSDVDMLVRTKDLNTAHRLLLENGWKEALPRAYYQGHYHWVYEQEESGCLLELHWRLKFPGTCAPELYRVWRDCAEIEAEGMRFLQMCPEDHLSYLAVNKAMQHFPSLLDFIDLHLIVERTPPRWKRLLSAAAADKTTGALWFGLAHCKAFFGTSVPDEVLSELSRSPSARGAKWLKRALALWGGVDRVPLRLLEGPYGRIYEAFLEGRLRGSLNVFAPLFFPSREKLRVLAGGSYPRYFLKNLAALAG